ncbi:signal protein [Hyalangium versicolor]|uniref:signal protein n=1 Tax=Hyalangium versicolor TaxID=2861190 RepID=UPI001CCC125E|nr:signal protein [Hyalangium versicolor]
MSSDTVIGSQKRVWKRRTYLIDREFQLKYIFMLASIGAGSIALFGGLTWWAHTAALEAGSGSEGFAGMTILWLTVLAVVGTSVALGLFGLVFTHRVAGPVHVMNLYVEALAAGHYPRLRPLRKYDELKKFFDRFSHAVERIRAREADEARALSQALSVFQPLATSDEARAALKVLEELHSRKREAVDKPVSGNHPVVPTR